MDEEQHHPDCTAHRTGQQTANRKHIEKRHAAEQGVPEPQSELVVRQHAGADWRGDDPELQRRFFEEDSGFAGAALGLQPLTDFEDSIDGEGINGLVGLEIETAQADEQRQAEKDEKESQPRPADAQSLMQVMSDQILGTLTFSIDTGFNSAWARNAGRSRSDLNPMWTVNGEITRSSHAPRRFVPRK